MDGLEAVEAPALGAEKEVPFGLVAVVSMFLLLLTAEEGT